jgi:hypothetical protein
LDAVLLWVTTSGIKCEGATQMDTRSPTATDTPVNITAQMSDNSCPSDDDPDESDVSDEADGIFHYPAK